MRLGLNKISLLLLLPYICYSVLVLMVHNSQAYPISSADAVVEDMRHIPQWHCLRYRKFDLVRRCRNYRVVRRQ